MKTNPLFEPSQEEIDALVSRYPLALVISAGAAGLSATPLPLLLKRDAHGSATLVGHFAASLPMGPNRRTDPEQPYSDLQSVTLSFMGRTFER